MASIRTPGMIIPIDGGSGILVFQYNPYEIHDNGGIKWAQLAAAGRKYPYLQFGCGELRHLQLSMEVSGNERGGQYVKSFCDQVRSFAEPSVRGAGMKRPPKLQFILGAHYSVTAVLVNYKIAHGAHRGSSNHMTYMADSMSLLPRDAVVRVDIVEWLD